MGEGMDQKSISRQIRRKWPSFFDAKSWFVFLLRTDICGGEPIPDDRGMQLQFLMWWLCFGRREYKGADPHAGTGAFGLRGGGVAAGRRRAVSRLLAYLLAGATMSSPRSAPARRAAPPAPAPGCCAMGCANWRSKISSTIGCGTGSRNPAPPPVRRRTPA